MFFNCSGLGADPDPKFHIQKCKENMKSWGGEGDVFFEGGGWIILGGGEDVEPSVFDILLWFCF